MIFEHFKGKNIHGFLNYDIRFNGGLNLIEGENGCGKTSILHIIYAISSQDFDFFGNFNFDNIVLEGKIDSGKNFKIALTKISKIEFELSITYQNQSPVLVKFIKSEDDVFINVNDFEDNKSLVDLFDKILPPHFLDINRKLFCGNFSPINKNQYILNRLYRDFPSEHTLLIAMKNAQDALFVLFHNIEKSCLQLESKKPQINQAFKNNLILNSFEFFEDQEVEFINDHKSLVEMRENALEAFENMNLNGFVENVNVFFDQLEDIQTKVLINEKRGKSKSANNIDNLILYQQWLLNQPQLKRFNQLIQFNQTYKKDKEKLFEPIQRIKNLVDLFLSKLNKRMIIQTNGEMQFEFFDGRVIKFYELSNGEIQIISIITQLVFLAESSKPNKGVFLIDEPELSIHSNWQLLLCDVFEEFSEQVQIVFSSNSELMLKKFNHINIINL